ncbi:hypothetical protein NL676_031985 [Syzygium grande]|nr:hypothetical protein NL676_031985 [Syzygium grande]
MGLKDLRPTLFGSICVCIRPIFTPFGLPTPIHSLRRWNFFKCKKSSLTGPSSKQWRFRDLLCRSNSDGKESLVVLTPSSMSRSGDAKLAKAGREAKKEAKSVVRPGYCNLGTMPSPIACRSVTIVVTVAAIARLMSTAAIPCSQF